MNLSKREKKFFENFASDLIVNTIVVSLANDNKELTEEGIEGVRAAIAAANIETLTNAIAEKLLKLVDFATLTRVEKLLTSPDVVKTTLAARDVGMEVQEELHAIIEEVFSNKEKEESAE